MITFVAKPFQCTKYSILIILVVTYTLSKNKFGLKDESMIVISARDVPKSAKSSYMNG